MRERSLASLDHQQKDVLKSCSRLRRRLLSFYCRAFKKSWILCVCDFVFEFLDLERLQVYFGNSLVKTCAVDMSHHIPISSWFPRCVTNWSRMVCIYLNVFYFGSSESCRQLSGIAFWGSVIKVTVSQMQHSSLKIRVELQSIRSHQAFQRYSTAVTIFINKYWTQARFQKFWFPGMISPELLFLFCHPLFSLVVCRTGRRTKSDKYIYTRKLGCIASCHYGTCSSGLWVEQGGVFVVLVWVVLWPDRETA